VFAKQKLVKNGIEIRLKTSVSEVSATEVHLDTGERIEYGLLIGTTGNSPAPIIGESGFPVEKGRIKVEPDMRVSGMRNVWAIGDCALVPNEYTKQSSPPTAQFAIRQARQLARNIQRAVLGQPTMPFRYRPQGLLAAIGRRNGVAEVYGLQFSGFLAWFLWRNVYFWKTPTWSRRLGIAIDWLTDALFPPNVVHIGSDGRAERSSLLRHEHYAAGDVIYDRGDPANALYIIEKGEAIVTLHGAPEQVVLHEGDRFGTSALEHGNPARTTTVQACAPLDVIALDRASMANVSGLLGVLSHELDRYLQPRRARSVMARISEEHPEIARLTVADVMQPPLSEIAPTDSLGLAVNRIAADRPSLALEVTDSERQFVGVCGREEIGTALASGLPLSTPIEQIMRTRIPVVSPKDGILSAVGVLLRSGLNVIPVIDKGRAVGAFSLPEAVHTISQRDDLSES
jgi:NADH dehydrogenase